MFEVWAAPRAAPVHYAVPDLDLTSTPACATACAVELPVVPGTATIDGDGRYRFYPAPSMTR
jgi:hypothetical protein